eukprot:jgi/Mesvir1/5824/Mv26558-RA.1
MEGQPPETSLASTKEQIEQRSDALKRKRDDTHNDAGVATLPGGQRVVLPPVVRNELPRQDRPPAPPPTAPPLEPTDWGIPEGWVACPQMGEPLEGLIPCKVPLGSNFTHKLATGTTFSPAEVVEKLKKRHQELGLVVDLTNTRRYYNVKEWSKLSVRHVKIACKGRDATPTEENVNEFFFEVCSFFQKQLQQGERREGGGGGLLPKYVLVHCTHGFNRTGYMIVNYLMRAKAMLCEEAVQAFARARPDGIYKEDYLSELYRLANETKFRTVPVPTLPAWKPPEVEVGDGPEDVLEAAEAKAAAEAEAAAAVPTEPPKMTIDDVLGSPIPLDHQLELQKIVSWGLGVLSPQALSNPRQAKQLNFPGSQPVSLDNQNFWEHISSKYYYVTWKADGTRYMLLITNDGAYVIDRTFTFRRMQLRFPRRKLREGDPAAHHHYTLLDGEMVLDKVDASGKLERRYLIYDMMMLNMEPIVNLPFSKRWQMILDEVIMPRKQDAVETRYDYDAEPCRVRRKDFYPLAHTEKILRDFIPSLPHEADGLIFQGWDECYVPRTSQELLKWKYAHMNSVDFLIDATDARSPRLFLRDKSSTGLRELSGATVTFPAGQSAKDFHKMIIECSWNSHSNSWEYMRTRVDKDSPNAWHVYEKVMASIRDNITEEVLLDRVTKVNNLPLYKSRKRP